MHATCIYVFVPALTSRHYALLTPTQHYSNLLNSFAKKASNTRTSFNHNFIPISFLPHGKWPWMWGYLTLSITQLSPFRHTLVTLIPYTPSHTHCMKPYLSVDLYTERSGSSQSSITAPSSRPCGFHDNIRIKKYIDNQQTTASYHNLLQLFIRIQKQGRLLSSHKVPIPQVFNGVSHIHFYL